MRKSFAAISATAALTMAALVAPAGVVSTAVASSEAEPTVRLAGFGHLAVDLEHGHAFVTEGSAGRVVVVDHKGTVLATIRGLYSAWGVAISPDSSTAYVTARNPNRIVGIDTTTYAVTSTIDIGDQACAVGMAFAADLLWYSYAPGCDFGQWNLGAIDLATQTPYDNLIATRDEQTPTLASVPGQPARIAAAGVSLWDVARDPAPSATLAASRQIGEPYGITVTPDGEQVLVPAGNGAFALSTADLETLHVYGAGTNAEVSAVRPDGLVAVGDDAGMPRVRLYLSGRAHVYGSFQFGSGTSLAKDGFAFGSTFLFAVTASSSGTYELHIFLPKGSSGLTLTTNKNLYAYHGTAIVTAHLVRGVENRTVSIYAQEVNGSKRLVKRAPVDDAGNLTVRVVVNKRTTFSAVYTGDAHTMAGNASHLVLVQALVRTRLFGYYKTVGHFRLYHTSKNPKIVATVSPNKAGKCIYYGGQYFSGGSWRNFKESRCFTLNAKSQSTVYWVGKHEVGQRFRFRGQWHSGPENEAANGNWSYVRFTR